VSLALERLADAAARGEFDPLIGEDHFGLATVSREHGPVATPPTMRASTQAWSPVAETKTSATAAHRLAAGQPFIRPQQHAIDAVAQAVQGEKVHFLNARSLRVRYADMHVFRSEQISDLAPPRPVRATTRISRS